MSCSERRQQLEKNLQRWRRRRGEEGKSVAARQRTCLSVNELFRAAETVEER